jgi:hypothetical protein
MGEIWAYIWVIFKVNLSNHINFDIVLIHSFSIVIYFKVNQNEKLIPFFVDPIFVFGGKFVQKSQICLLFPLHIYNFTPTNTPRIVNAISLIKTI